MRNRPGGGRWRPRTRLAGLTALLMVVTCVVAGPAAARRPNPAAAPAGLALATGYNFNGQLGDGTFNSRSTPGEAAPPTGVTVTQVSAGFYHSLAVTPDGQVLGWGQNAFGELGNGETSGAVNLPVRATLPSGATVTQVSGGYHHSLAVTSDGRVLAWGYNGYGQLGDGTTTSREVPIEVALPDGAKAKQVAAGYGYSLALTTDGRVLAWGYNGYGQLGDGTTTSRDTPGPVALPPGLTITQVAAGDNHGLALTSDHHVWGWGLNQFGELGTNPTWNYSPVQVGMPPGADVTRLAAGDRDSLAVTFDGSALAWGQNNRGQLGDGTTTDRNTPVEVALPAGVTVTQLDSHSTHSVAATSDGRALGWGGNADGQLGDGTTTQQPTPVFMLLPGHLNVSQVAAGLYHSLLIAQRVSSDTSLTAEPMTAKPGQEVRLTASVACNAGTPTGTVTFLDGDTVIGTAELDTDGVATLTTTELPGGRHHITARYEGNEVCPPSTSAPVTVTITEEPPPPRPCGWDKLKIDKTADRARVRVGGKVRYRIHVTNTCHSVFNDATFTDDLTGVLRSGRIRGPVHATTGHVTRTRGAFTWTGDLPAGHSADITFTVVTRMPGIMRNLVTWRCSPADVARRNCTAETRTKVYLPSTT
ncbi:Ig-like domain repeat protein [Spirillospora sp. NPDC052269]